MDSLNKIILIFGICCLFLGTSDAACNVTGYSSYYSDAAETQETCLSIKFDKGDWNTHRITCLVEGGDLLYQNVTPYLQATLAETLSPTAGVSGANYFVGAQDTTSEGLWLWVDGSLVDVIWATGEPDNVDNQDCGCLARTSYLMGSCWCDFLQYAVCQTAA